MGIVTSLPVLSLGGTGYLGRHLPPERNLDRKRSASQSQAPEDAAMAVTAELVLPDATVPHGTKPAA
jgi:hypothetical protein